ncbi:MAG TPA: APC family permease [Longimicrobiaceae bacterium]|nr:APC family permease [Longimicrobiaceae bacterium]
MKKTIELLFYVSFGAGMAFGMSSFTMLSELNHVVNGPWVVLAIVLAGAFCAMISASVAELASMYPSAPGVRTYLKVAFSNRTSLVLVYMYLIFMVLVAAIESYMFALVLGAVFPGTPQIPVVIGLIGFTMVVNMLGLELPRGMQIISTLGLIGLILSLGAYGFAGDRPALILVPVLLGVVALLLIARAFKVELSKRLRFAAWAVLVVAAVLAAFALAADRPAAPSPQALRQGLQIPAAVSMAVYLFIGFEWITMLGMKPDSYKRTIPVSMPLAILTNVVAYSFVAFGMWLRLPAEVIAERPIPQVPYFTAVLGASGPYLALLISFLAIFSTFNAGVMGGSRLLYILAREGVLPKFCAWMSAKGAPLGGVAVLGLAAMASSIVVVTYDLPGLVATIGSALVGCVYSAFMLAVLRLRKTKPDARRSYRTHVPVWAQWAVIVIMPALGVAALFSQPDLGFWPLAGAFAIVLAAALMTWWSLSRSENERLPVKPGPALGS